jgi:hypothetical protein
MIISKCDDLIVVKVFKETINDIDIYDVDMVCNFFKKLLVKIKKKYDVKGLCYIDVYTNEKFGMVIEINNIYKYDENDEVEVKINFYIDAIFMKEIIDLDSIKDKEVYYYAGKYYTYYDRMVDSNVIYKYCLDIINKGIRVK